MSGTKGKVHIIGVCGTAMAGVAALLKSIGFDVSGSDSMFYPPMPDQLRRFGIKLFQFSPENVKDKDLIIVGNAISKDNIEVQSAISLGKKIMSYPEAINEFFGDKTFFVVAGTHGKTTTTSIISYILNKAGYDPSFLIGGIPKNFGVSARVGKGDIFVIEGDEYDTAFFDKKPKFWHFKPKRAIIGQVEYDHADIYPDFESYLSAFVEFSKKVEEKLVFFGGNKAGNIISENSKAKHKVSYGYENDGADFFPENITKTEIGYEFSISKISQRFRINILGRHNIINTLASFLLLEDMINPENFSEYLEGFEGVRRRLEIIFSIKNIYVIDDFAHHPTEIESGIKSAREFFDKVILAFEPRSFTSRTSVHQEGFKNAFEKADAVFIGKIYREEKIPENKKLKIEEIVSHLKKKGIYAEYNQSVSERLAEFILNTKSREKEEKKIAVIFMSSGDFYGEKEKFIMKLRRANF